MSAPSLRARFKETVSESILVSAEELAAEVGLRNAGLAAIAQRAGVAVGTIYNHFSDRNELFEALFARRRAETVQYIDDVFGPVAKAPFATQIETLVRAVLGSYDAKRNFLRLALDADAPPKPLSSARFPAAAALEVLRVRAEKVLRIGVKEKVLRGDPELLSLFFVTALRTMLIARVDSPEPLVDETAAVLDLFLHGASGPIGRVRRTAE